MTHDRTDEPTDTASADLTNGDLARIFHEIGDMLEVKGELVFKTVAYHRAADAIGRSPVDLVAAYRAGTPPRIPGVGKAISDKIEELATTGHMAFYDRLRAEIPPGLVELLRIPGLGPEDRPAAPPRAQDRVDGRPPRRPPRPAGSATSAGMSAKTESLVLEGIARLDSTPDRMLLDRAEELVAELIDAARGHARACAGSNRPGSFRRRRETIGDLDLLAETDDAGALIGRFTTMGIVDHVVNAGGYKAAVRLQRGPAGRPDGHAAGRGRHVPHPLHGLQGAQRPPAGAGPGPGLVALGEGLPADRRGRRAADRRRDAELRTFATETEAYAFLGLPLHRAGAARGRRRDRGRARGDAARPHRRRPTCAATCTATRTGPTASTRSRSWPRPPGGAATPTRS